MCEHEMNLADAILTDHAVEQLSRRQLTRTQIQPVLEKPDAIIPVRSGRIIAQALVHMEDPPRAYLLRVVVDIDRQPAEVVTAYRTSKIDKYRSAT